MIRTFFLAVLVAVMAVPVGAQDAAPATFFVERIEVRDASRVSPEVVIAESRLREGESYTEVELRDASARLSRLPFLLGVDFSLERGSERGRHVLVLTIAETRAFFYSLDVRPILHRRENVSFAPGDDLSPETNKIALGMRFFVGRRGAIHFGLYGADFQASLIEDYTAFAGGYTQYDLFGTRAFATLNLKVLAGGYGSGTISPQLVVGMPLSPNQTLTLSFDDQRLGSRTREAFGTTIHEQAGQRVIGARWQYNTTNHPTLPTRGTIFSVSPRVASVDGAESRYAEVDGVPTRIPLTYHSRGYLLELGASRYWETSPRDSVSLGLSATTGQIEHRNSLYGDHDRGADSLVLRAGYSHSLWDRNRAKEGDSRLELNLDAGSFRDEFGAPYVDPITRERAQASASWVRRSSWGTLRLGMGYAW